MGDICALSTIAYVDVPHSLKVKVIQLKNDSTLFTSGEKMFESCQSLQPDSYLRIVVLTDYMLGSA